MLLAFTRNKGGSRKFHACFTQFHAPPLADGAITILVVPFYSFPLSAHVAPVLVAFDNQACMDATAVLKRVLS